MGCGASKVHAAPRFKMPELEYSTPMLVMPYPQFKAQDVMKPQAFAFCHEESRGGVPHAMSRKQHKLTCGGG